MFLDLSINPVQPILEIKVGCCYLLTSFYFLRGSEQKLSISCLDKWDAVPQILCVLLVVPDKLCIRITGMIDAGQIIVDPGLKTVCIEYSPDIGRHFLPKHCFPLKASMASMSRENLESSLFSKYLKESEKLKNILF